MLLRHKNWGILSLFFVFLLQACGFQPLYPVDRDQGYAVYISQIQDREGQLLRHHLQTLFSSHFKKDDAPYTLTVALEKSEEELGFRRDETSRRTRITLQAKYSLIEKASQKVLISQTVSVLTGYSVGSKSSFASLPLIVSEKDAIERALSQLARDIHISISSYLVSSQEANHSEEIAG